MGISASRGLPRKVAGYLYEGKGLDQGERNAVHGQHLEEVAETAAVGDVARIYAEIRATTGLPFVSLVYRRLATQPRVLKRTWAVLAPVLASREGRAAAADLEEVDSPDVVSIPASALSAVGVDADEFAATTNTLRAYTRANSCNLLAAQLVLSRRRRPRTGPPSAPRPVGPRSDLSGSSLLPMSDLRNLDRATVVLLEEISVYFSGENEPLLVPSLWRHFGHRPALAALLWTSLRPAALDGSLDRRADALLRRARVLARGIRVDDVPLDLRAVGFVRPFAVTIPRMLVCGAMMRSALREGAKLGVRRE